jgi:hypothetical protein
MATMQHWCIPGRVLPPMNRTWRYAAWRGCWYGLSAGNAGQVRSHIVCSVPRRSLWNIDGARADG